MTIKTGITIFLAAVSVLLGVLWRSGVSADNAAQKEIKELRERGAALEQFAESIAARHREDLERWRGLEEGYQARLVEQDREIADERRRWVVRVKELEARLADVPVEPSDLATETTDLLQAYRSGALIEPMALRLFRANRSAVEASRAAALSHGGAEEQVAHLGRLLELSEARCETLRKRGDAAKAAAEGCGDAFEAYQKAQHEAQLLWEAERELLEQQARRRGWRKLLWGFGGGFLVGLVGGGI